MPSDSEVQTSLSIVIRSDILRKDDITAGIGSQPTRSFEKGESGVVRVPTGQLEDGTRTFGTKHFERPTGIWKYSTENFIETNYKTRVGDFMGTDDLNDHAELLLNVISPASDFIQKLISDPDYSVTIYVYYYGPNGFLFKSSILSQLCSLCEAFCADFFNPESDLDDEEE